MVYTSTAIITSILVVGTAAPILAAPVEPRIDSGFSSVNNRALPPVTESAVPAGAPATAPEAAAKEKPSGVGPAVVRGLAARGVEVEAGAETGTPQSGGFLHSPSAQDLLGRAALAAISSILRREPEFADLLGHELAIELEARSAIGSAITGGAASGAGFTATKNLIQHLNRAGGAPLETIPEGSEPEPEPESDSDSPSSRPSSSGSTSSSSSATTSFSPGPFSPGSVSTSSPSSDSTSSRPSSSGSTSSSSSATTSFSPGPFSPGSVSPSPSSSSSSSSGSSDWEQRYLPTLPPSAPSTGIFSKISLLSTPAKVVLGTGIGLTVAGVVAGAVVGSQKAHRDLDADTLHLLGRDLFARSFGIDELD